MVITLLRSGACVNTTENVSYKEHFLVGMIVGLKSYSFTNFKRRTSLSTYV